MYHTRSYICIRVCNLCICVYVVTMVMKVLHYHLKLYFTFTGVFLIPHGICISWPASYLKVTLSAGALYLMIRPCMIVTLVVIGSSLLIQHTRSEVRTFYSADHQSTTYSAIDNALCSCDTPW